MAKIQLSPETRAQERRRPGFALLKISGWKHSPELSEMSIQRSEDEKYLGADGQWEPIPVWHTLANMTARDEGSIEADVPPAFVDPIIISPNNSYRVTLKSGSESETRTMRIANGVLASSAAGSSPESLEQGNGLILGDAIAEPIKEPEPEPEPVVIEEAVEEVQEEIVETVVPPVTEIKKDSFFPLHKDKIISALIVLLLLIASGLAWYFKLIPNLDFGGGDGTESTPAKTSAAESASANLTDLELLQKFIRTKPDTDQILAQAKEWGSTQHCDAMLRLMVHSAHKSGESKIALEYAKMHDPAQFSKGECIEKPDVDTAQYWYQKAVEGGNADAKSLLEKLEKK
jgi:hypothetical protein